MAVYVNECESFPCENGTTCNDVLVLNGYTCDCYTGFTGSQCQRGMNIESLLQLITC